MPVRFEHFRLSLTLRAQIDAFEPSPLPKREEVIRQIFLGHWDFKHKGTEYRYRPDTESSSANAIVGGIGRARDQEEGVETRRGWEPTSHRYFQFSVLAVDPRDHPDGQKIAMEADPLVGTPAPVLSSWVTAINKSNPNAPYIFQVNPIFDNADFWDFVADQPKITSITFEFVVPNGVWNNGLSVDEEMREAGASMHAELITNTVKHRDGLNTESQRIKEGVDYVANGSGALKARAPGNRTYNSKNRTKAAILDEEDAGESLVSLVVRRLEKVFGRE